MSEGYVCGEPALPKGMGLGFAERNQNPGGLRIRRNQCLGSDNEKGI